MIGLAAQTVLPSKGGGEACGNVLELAAFEAAELRCRSKFAGGSKRRRQFRGYDVDWVRDAVCGFRISARCQGYVFKVRMERHRHRRRQRPGSCRPDDGEHVAPRQQRVECGGIRGQLVAHVNRRARMHFVLNFGLGQGGTVVNAPIDRLESAIDKPLLKKAVKRLESSRFIVARHGHVGLIPPAEASDSLKLCSLQVNILLRIGATCIQYCRNGHLQLFTAELLVNLDLDRQAVAVVTGNVRRIKPCHGFGLDDKVLQPLVQGMAEVNRPVRIRRAVVKNVGGSALAGLPQFVVESQRGPLRKPKRLILRQIGLHREGGLRQCKGRLQLRRWRH